MRLQSTSAAVDVLAASFGIADEKLDESMVIRKTALLGGKVKSDEEKQKG